MILESVTPFRSRDVAFKLATEDWELRAYYCLRARIFRDEQKLFTHDDRDDIDERAIPLVALTRVAGVPDEIVGVVRVWQESPGSWWGGRLGTHPDHRRNGVIGPGLIDLAVRTACGRGCRRFLATVQTRNVKLFERLHWSVIHPVEVCGQPHALMRANLLHYGGAGP
ncbi:MAG: GNAT family N-acetyltransferase [Myxococcota bacterium]|nr:GNAT family N-acetyltransferase [Myxococcota bacterium]